MSMEARARVTCPQCHQTVIDTDMRGWIEESTPAQFHDAMMRLVNAHADTCKPVPPAYTKKMRRGRLLWRAATWGMSGWFMALGIAYITGVFDEAGFAYGWTLWLSGLCLFFAGQREKASYANGYFRGRFSGEHNQRHLISRWLHPGDGVHDPDDPPEPARVPDHPPTDTQPDEPSDSKDEP